MIDVTLASSGVLSTLAPSDAPELAAHMDRAREHIRPWVGPSFVTTDVAGALQTLTRYADIGGIFGIRVDGTLVGGVMFFGLDAAENSCEVGCWLEPAAEGHGHITAAVTELLRYLFEERGLHRIEWRCRSDNDRSIAVAKRLGLSFEGRLREAWLVGDTFHDQDVWSILDREWSN